MIRNRYLTIFLAGFIFLMLFGVGGVYAQGDAPTDDEVNAIARELYCPVCENIPLDVCPTQACEQWRATIREKLEIGWNDQQIKQYFVDQYGARVLATPPAEGLNWLVYILPPLAFLAGAVVLWRAVKNWRTEGQETAVEALASDDPYIARLEEELQRRERGES
jgi:cytochrome c-type biogenesis protein CcmH